MGDGLELGAEVNVVQALQLVVFAPQVVVQGNAAVLQVGDGLELGAGVKVAHARWLVVFASQVSKER